MNEIDKPKLTSRKDLQSLDGYHSPQLDLEVKLNTNESPYSLPKKFLKLLQKELAKKELNRYPDRESRVLKEAIADFHNLAGSGKNILVGNGSNEILQAIMLAYAGESGKVALFEPTYALHSHIARIVGAEIIVGRRNDDWQIELTELEGVLSQSPDIVFLCVPNNPTGTVESKEFINKAVELVADANSLLVVDEAYSDFIKTTSFGKMDLWSEDLPIILVRTFSKNWSLAAIRLGYAVAPEWIINEIQKVILPYNLNSITQIAGELALQFVAEQKAVSQEIMKGRDLLYSGICELNDKYLAQNEKPIFKVWESSANFVLFQVLGSEFSAQNIWEGLIVESILIRYYEGDSSLDECLRVTVGTPKENIRFLDALKGIIE